MQSLTERQEEVLQFIAVFQEECGVPPTLREIAHHFKFRSPTAASDHLRALRRKGYLTYEPRLARYSRILSHWPPVRRQVMDIPVYGSFSTAAADQRDQHTQESISVDPLGLGFQLGDRMFALRSQDDSMSWCNILEGDLVILAPNRKPRAGDVVAAWMNNESPLETFAVVKGKSCLHAENPRYPAPIPVDELIIQGVMVALIRRRTPTPVVRLSPKPDSCPSGSLPPGPPPLRPRAPARL
jgi:repressor LexA